MYLSEAEKDRRYEKLRKIMAEKDIGAFLVAGNNCVGGATGTGSFRYLTDYFVIFYYGLLVFFRDEDPILLVGSELQHVYAKKYSWVQDIRVSSDLAEAAAGLLADRGLTAGKVGIVGMESISAAAYLTIRERLPHAVLLDGTSIFFDIRLKKGDAERELLATAAGINDGAYDEVLKQIRPGIKEYEIVGILEGYQRGKGADQTFNLISSGPFPSSADGTPFQGHLWYPGAREIREGDCILMEITADYGGYWNQLLRMVSVGQEPPEITRFHKAALAGIRVGLEKFIRGMKTSDFVQVIAAAVEREGFRLVFPVGHFAGLDLMEARVSLDSQVVLEPGISAVIHPCVMDDQGIRILWGETYFITEDGPVRLNRADDALFVV